LIVLISNNIIYDPMEASSKRWHHFVPSNSSKPSHLWLRSKWKQTYKITKNLMVFFFKKWHCWILKVLICGDVLGVCAKENIMIPPTPKLLALLDNQKIVSRVDSPMALLYCMQVRLTSFFTLHFQELRIMIALCRMDHKKKLIKFFFHMLPMPHAPFNSA
jgi:hypothetical protein